MPKPKKTTSHFRALMAARHDVHDELLRGANMNQYLLGLANSATTEKEEAETIMRAVAAIIPETAGNDYRLRLMETARLVWAGFLPAAVLLGVVRALKPAHLSLAVCSFSADHGCAIAKAGPTDGEARNIEWQRHPHDYMAALIAILEAAGSGGEVGNG